jgi:Protein of unknown function (DUF3999)
MRRAWWIGAIVVALGAIVAAQPERSAPRFERRVETAGTGPRRLAIDGALLAGGLPFRVARRADALVAEGGLADLRLVTDSGAPLPYLLAYPPSQAAVWTAGSLLSIAPTKETSGFEVDLGAQRQVDAIQLRGLPAPYLKRVRIEASGDRARWTMLVAEGTVFDLPDERLRQDTLPFTAGAYRYLRATWDDRSSGRLPLPSTLRVRLALPHAPLSAATLPAVVEPRPSEPGVSRYRLTLPGAALPATAIVLDVGGGHVYRHAVVTESRFAGAEATPVELGAAQLSRVVRDGIRAGTLRIPITAPTEAEIELTISNGENEPLDVRGAAIEVAQLPFIYFEAPAGGVVARYGGRGEPAPVYDLEAVRRTLDIGAVAEAKWSSAEPVRLSETAAEKVGPGVSAGAAIDPSPFRFLRPVTGDRRDGLAAVAMDAHALAYSRGPSSRFADVRLLDSANQQIPYLLERRSEPLSVDLVPAPASAAESSALAQGDGSRRRTVYAIELPQPRLPAATLVLETGSRVFDRSLRLGVWREPAGSRREPWFEELASGRWRHADERIAAPAITLAVATIDTTRLALIVDEGDNAPLPIAKARLLLPSYRLRFYAPAAGQIRLAYGRADLREPQYDLKLLAPRVMGARADEVGVEPPAAPATAEPLVSPRAFWTMLIATVVVLLALVVKLLRNSDSPAS